MVLNELFFPKNYEKFAAGISAPKSLSVIRLNYSIFLYSNTPPKQEFLEHLFLEIPAPNLAIFTFQLLV